MQQNSNRSASNVIGQPGLRGGAKRAVLGKLNRWLSYVLFAGVGSWAHAIKFPFMIEYRPDFHRLGNFDEYQTLRRAWLHGNRVNNGGDFARFYALYQNLKQVIAEGVPGAFVELGVYKGNSAAMLATFGRQTGRRTYLFDTFQGFDARDLTGIDKDHPLHFTDTSLPHVKNLVGDEMVTYVQGFFPESLQHIEPPHQVAVVHVDFDLHEPIKAALEVFYPRMAPGGLMILHDYSSGHWAGATVAIDSFFHGKPEKPVLIPDKSGTAIVRKV